MDFESDRLVLEYLGQVGDAAQRKLRPADRARLVDRLRTQINSERERASSDNPSQVRTILARMGSPEAVVANEVLRAPSYDAHNALAGAGLGETAGYARGSRATIAAQIGFRPDSSPVPSQRDGSDGDGLEAKPIAPLGDGLIGWPAYPIGILPEGSSDWEGGEIVGPEPVRRIPMRASARELMAIVLIAVGAMVGSAVVVVIGLLVVFTSGVWAGDDKRMAAYVLPSVTVAAFVTAMWLRATGHAGVDLTRSQAVHRFEELLPAIPRIAGAAAAVYLLFKLLRTEAPDAE